MTLREGGETSLILALLFSSLKAARHVAYRAAAWTGSLIALALSVLAGLFLHDLGELGPIFEGTLAWLGAGFIASLAVQLHWNAIDYRTQLKQLRDSATAERASWATAFAIGSFAFVSVIREGLETAIFLSNGAGLRTHGSWLGAGVGLALAAAFGVSIYLGFRKLHIKAFLRTTEILLFTLVFSLFLSGLHEFSEAGLVAVPPALEIFHLTWLQGGLFLQALLCVGPFLYLAFAGGSPRHYVRAAGIAILLALTPMSLSATARRWEHARLAPADRAAAVTAERNARGRAQAMTAALQTLEDRIRKRDVTGARASWVEARRSFVQIEPLLARADGEMAEELNGEPGEAAGFHGIESALFEVGAPWAADARARALLLGDVGNLTARARVAERSLAALTLDPATLRDAWHAHRWTFLGRIDGQESASSQTSILELSAALDALDADLGGRGYYTEPIRAAVSPALMESGRGVQFGEYRPEVRVAADELHMAPPLVGPDRVWETVDREPLRRAVEDSFARIENGAGSSMETGIH